MAEKTLTMPLQMETAASNKQAETAAGNISPRTAYIRIKGQGAVPVIVDLKSRTVVPVKKS